MAPPDEGIVHQDGAAQEGSPAPAGARAAFVAIAGDSVAVRWWLVQTLGVDQRWSERLVPASGPTLAFPATDTSGVQWIAVTPISRTGVAGPAAMWRAP